MDQARAEIPKLWYEHRLPVLSALAITAPAVYFQEKYLPFSSLAEHLGSLALYGSAAIADHRSSIETLKANDVAAELGLETGVYETNPIIGKVATLKDYSQAVKRKRTIAAEIMGVVVAAVQPAVGIPLGLSRIRDAMGNKRTTKLLRRASELANS